MLSLYGRALRRSACLRHNLCVSARSPSIPTDLCNFNRIHTTSAFQLLIDRSASTISPATWSNLRQFSTTPGNLSFHKPANAGGSFEKRQNTPKIVDHEEIKEENLSLIQRFKAKFKKYWYVMLPVHFVTSWLYFGGFYYLASIGVNPVPLLEYWGVPDEYISAITDSSLGLLAIAFAMYKVATPLRYLTTLGLSGVSVKILAAKGMLPSSEQVTAVLRAKWNIFRNKRGL